MAVKELGSTDDAFVYVRKKMRLIENVYKVVGLFLLHRYCQQQCYLAEKEFFGIGVFQ